MASYDSYGHGVRARSDMFEQANEELGRRVRSWKVAYLREVQNREAVEKELSNVRQVLVAMTEHILMVLPTDLPG